MTSSQTILAAFLIGCAVGLGAFYIYEQHKTNPLTTAGTDIVFPPKNFYNGTQFSGNEVVNIAGALTGDGVGYKNNVVDIACYQSDMKCYATEVDQIGSNQIGDLNPPTVFAIKTWAPYEITAIYGDDGYSCWKTTLNIERAAGTAEWVQEAVNQSQIQCKDSENKIYKWTIEDPPLWASIHKQAVTK